MVSKDPAGNLGLALSQKVLSELNLEKVTTCGIKKCPNISNAHD
jgi:hypothetical protein